MRLRWPVPQVKLARGFAQLARQCLDRGLGVVAMLPHLPPILFAFQRPRCEQYNRAVGKISAGISSFHADLSRPPRLPDRFPGRCRTALRNLGIWDANKSCSSLTVAKKVLTLRKVFPVE